MKSAMIPLPDNPNVVDFLSLVNTATKDALMSDIEARFAAGHGFSVATLNLDHITKLRQRPDFVTAYRQHSHVVADGNPIVWMLRLTGRNVELVPGSELIEPLSALAARMDVSVALFGSDAATLDQSAAALEASHPGLRVVCKIAPPMGFDPASDAAAASLKQIQSSGARLCFVALGAPKQEFLAARAADLVPACGFVSIGAGLDFIAGTQTRAPVWVRRIAMEWFWRMATNPSRLARRYWDCFVVMLQMLGLILQKRSRQGKRHKGHE